MTDHARISAELLPLVLAEGQRGTAEGVFTLLGEAVRLLADDGFLERSSTGAVSVSMAVKVRLPATVDRASVDGRDMIVSGVFVDGGLSVAGAEDLESRPEERQRSAPLFHEPRPVGRSQHPPLRGAVERALIEDGVLLDVWQPEGEDGRRVALATDVQRVRRALPEHYEVIQSRWSAAELQAITAVIADSDATMSFGNDRNGQGQLRVRATLLHLPPSLARELSAFPADAVSINVLVKPAAQTAS